jgi:hypothetical protein
MDKGILIEGHRTSGKLGIFQKIAFESTHCHANIRIVLFAGESSGIYSLPRFLGAGKGPFGFPSDVLTCPLVA